MVIIINFYRLGTEDNTEGPKPVRVLSWTLGNPNQQMGHNNRTEKNPVLLMGIEPLAAWMVVFHYKILWPLLYLST